MCGWWCNAIGLPLYNGRPTCVAKYKYASAYSGLGGKKKGTEEAVPPFLLDQPSRQLEI